jgi:multidrug efflux pump subunit AcrA (membrane-fusion protein)
VERGDITVDITAAGNLSYSIVEDLAFDIAGTVKEVLVEEGDVVEEGQVLATLDEWEWEQQLTQKELDLWRAEIDLRNAENALDDAKEPYTEDEIEDAEDDVDSAEDMLDYAREMLAEARQDDDEDAINTWEYEVYQTQRELAEAKSQLEEMEEAGDEDTIELKELELELAEEELEYAQKELEEAQETSPEIIAPFDGFVTYVNVEGGDEVLKGTVAVQIADPERFKAQLLVSEVDIFEVELGGEAWVQVDALSMLDIPAKVTYISPTATIQSGVVNYEVEVELESLETVRQEMLEAMQERQEAMQEAASGEMPEQLKEAIEQGLISQEEAEEMVETAQQIQGEQQGPMLTLLEDSQLKEGLNVTVSIIVEQKSDVLLVPNQAITYQGRRAYVQVLTDGAIEERLIQTGINDWQYTEVVYGLNEGEEVVIPVTTATTGTTSERGFQGPPGGIMPPGMIRR